MSDPNDAPRRYELVDADGSVEQEDTSSGDYVGDVVVNGVATDINATGTNTRPNDDGNPPSTSAEVGVTVAEIGDTTDAAATGKPAAFILPNGEVMNCKNTLQSFDEVVERASPQLPQRRGAAMAIPKNLATTEPSPDLEVQQQENLSDLSYSHHGDDPTIQAQAIPMPSAIVVVAPPSIHVVEAQVYDPGTTASTASTATTSRTALLWLFSVFLVSAIAGTGVYCGTGNCGTDSKKSTTTSSNNAPTTSPTNVPVSDEQLSVACNFLSLTDLATCRITTDVTLNTLDSALFIRREASTIPTEIGLLTELTRLVLWYSKLSGSIPSTLGNLVQLTDLELPYNLLTGTIPSTLGNLANLTSLDLEDNQLTGSIPSALENLKQLSSMRLTDNQLTGTIPSTLCSFFGITIKIDCANIICECCQDIDSIMCPNTYEQLLVACNFLSLPDVSVCQARKLFNGAIVGNTIPTEIGLLTQLTFLGLSENPLAGTIPSTLGLLTLLTSLDLSLNQLTGTIPSTLGNLSQLNSVDLYNNQFSGTIPSALGNLIQLTYLDLDINQLSGPIPSTLGNLTKLEYLYLDTNQLSGTIPSTLGNLTQLTRLFLHNNTQLNGTIPATLCSIPNISIGAHFSIPGIVIGVDCANIECACCGDGSNFSDSTGEYASCPVT